MKTIICSLGECKWTNSTQGYKLLDKMIRLNKEVMPDVGNTWYYLFSKSGFTDELIQYAIEQKNIKLITLDDMKFKE